jgi:prolyl 4-hydroxylase
VAQAELAGLSGDWALAKALRDGSGNPPESAHADDAVDLASWVTLPAAQVLVPSPRIVAVPGFLSPELCDWLIGRARPDLKRAQTFDPRTGGAQVHEGRNHSCIGFNVVRSDVVFAIMRARMALLTGHSLMGFEDTSVLHYSPGEQFAPHYDFIEANTAAGQREIASAGQRAVTFLAYLNEGYDGGETAFPVLGRSFKGKKGDALFYDNALPDGSPDRRTLHAGTPLKRGEKWLTSQWIRSRPAWLSQ